VLGPGHWMPPDKQESYRDRISKKLLLTCVTTFLAVMLKLTRILVTMDLELLYVIRGKMNFHIVGCLFLNQLMKVFT
jgi:hypothetical protein